MTGETGRIGRRMAAVLAATATALAMPAAAGAQAVRHGSMAGVPMADTGWNGQGWGAPRTGWTGPEDGPEMHRTVAGHRDDGHAGPPPPPLRDARLLPPVDARRFDGHAAFDGRYARPDRGDLLPSYFLAPAFHVRDFPAWGLAPPGPGRNWIRYYDDAVLTGPDGRVADVRYGIDWDRSLRTAARGPVGDGRGGRRHGGGDRAYDAGYADGYDAARDGVGPGTAVTTYGGPADGGYYGAGSYAPGTIVTTTTPGTITTTTTVTEDVVTTAAPRRTWRAAPVRRKTWVAPSTRWSR